MTASDFHAAFVSALREPDAHPQGYSEQAAQRFSVYRNNVHRALAEALTAAYPAVARLVGSEFFDAMARVFHDRETVRPASLALHGGGFPEFLATFEPVAHLAYLPDVARLERAWLEALHAADAAPLDPATVAPLMERAESLVFAAHPAARVVTSEHPAVTIWQHNRTDAPQETPLEVTDTPEAALITRPDMQVVVTPINPAAAAFATTLLSSETLGAGAAHVLSAAPDFDIAAALSVLLGAGAFSAVQEGNDR